jgi:hypothetical protein
LRDYDDEQREKVTNMSTNNTNTLTLRPLSSPFSALGMPSLGMKLVVALPVYRRWATPSQAVTSVSAVSASANLNSTNAFEGTAGAAIAVATAAILDHAWYITGDAPSFQANKCTKRPQSWSEPPGS